MVTATVITYTLRVTNNGDADAENVTLTDIVPAGTTVSDNPDSGDITTVAGQISWTLGTIAANGGFAEVSFSVLVD